MSRVKQGFVEQYEADMQTLRDQGKLQEWLHLNDACPEAAERLLQNSKQEKSNE